LSKKENERLKEAIAKEQENGYRTLADFHKANSDVKLIRD